jgi:predicted transcriptional regulator of viral defense system
LVQGKYAFALHELRAGFPGQTDIAHKFALKRLVDKGLITSIHKGYYLIIPPQYRSNGVLPLGRFIKTNKK